MTELREALAVKSEPPAQTHVRDLIERMKPELVRALATPEAAERLMRMYLTAIRLNPLLLKCSDESLLAALMLTAQVGLEPGPLGHVYLIPYGSECQWMLGYTGIVELAARGGRTAGLAGEVVWDCDEYKHWRDEKGAHFRHEQGAEGERGDRVAAYCTWQSHVGGRWTPGFLHVPVSRVVRARKASRAFQKGSGPWVTDEDAMWRKTAVRAARPFLLLSAEAGYAVASDGSTVVGITVENETAEAILVAEEAEE